MASDSAEIALPSTDGLIEARTDDEATRNLRAVLENVEQVASIARMAKDQPDAYGAMMDSFAAKGVDPEVLTECRNTIQRKVDVYTELERWHSPRPSLRYKFERASDLRNLPPVEWLIEGVILSGSLVVLSGKEASGKTFVALSFAQCIASGKAWLGRRVVAGSVAYVVAEGFGSRFMQRIAAWEAFNSEADPSLYVLGEAPQLLTDASTDALIAAAKNLPDLRLIVVDTLARAFVGGEENSAKDVGMLIANADRLRRATGATVLLIHHETKAGGTPRGSSALTGAADTLLSLERRGHRDLALSCDKQKNGEEFKRISLRLADVALPSGEASLVVTDAPQSAGANAGSGLAPVEQNALDVLTRQFPNGATSATWQQASGVPRGGSWNRVRDVLVQRGIVECRGSGRGATYAATVEVSPLSIPPPPPPEVDPLDPS